jgi:hypothetical protein
MQASHCANPLFSSHFRADPGPALLPCQEGSPVQQQEAPAIKRRPEKHAGHEDCPCRRQLSKLPPAVQLSSLPLCHPATIFQLMDLPDHSQKRTLESQLP